MNEPFPSKETFSDQIDSNTLLFSRSSVNDLFFNTLKPDLSLIKEDDYDDSKYSSPYRQGRKSHSPLESQISPKINKSQKKTLISTGLDYEDINKEHIKKTNENNINIDNPVSNINLSKEIKDEEDEESSGIDLEDEIYAEKLRQEPLYKENQCLIFPDDVFKEIWEIILALMILYSCLWVPYYMAFDIPTSNGTTTVDVLCDIIFIIDILINFNSAFYDCQDVLVINRGEIAKEYIKFWFWLDFISALPFSFIIEYSYADKSFRFQRLTKLTRFIRFFKMIKERNKILKYVNKVLKISSGGAENLLGPVVFMTLFCHITSCFYYMMCVYEEGPDTWINYYIDKEDNEKYLTTFYWVTQTVVTTGYGDIPCKTAYEKMFAIGVMLIGVLVYSFCVGSITNFLINLDEEHEIFNEKIITLYSMKHYYDLDFFLCKRIERFLRFGKKTQIQEQQKNLLMELPKNLKIELSAIMYKNLIVGIEFFKNKPKRFLAFICPYLKLIKINQEDYICDEGDRANEIYFIKSGTVAIVLKNFDNYIVYSFQQGDYFGEVKISFFFIKIFKKID